MTDTVSKRLPSPHEFEQLLAHFINVTLLGGNAAVDRDTRLFEDGYMNSLRILDLIAVVEKTLGRRVPDRAVRLANFRTIGAIVSAFHPDAGEQPATSPDSLFQRRRDRSRFASPLEALQQRGDVTITGTGQVSLAGAALEVLEAVDGTVMHWARDLGASEHRYPSLIDSSVLERAGQQPNTAVIPSEARDRRRPDRGMSLFRDDRDSSPPALRASARNDTVLSPAVCYHTYPELAEKRLGSSPAFITARGHCYRSEDGNHIPLERLWEFTMREIIVLGTREEVEATRQSLVRQATAFVETLELDASIETATDPFFTTGDEGRRLMQQAGALKYELRLTVDASGRTIAAASFNHHHDFFGARFGIRLADDTVAHTGCVAFGLERWVLALCSQHGIEPRSWPNAARDWLSGARARAHGAGA